MAYDTLVLAVRSCYALLNENKNKILNIPKRCRNAVETCEHIGPKQAMLKHYDPKCRPLSISSSVTFARTPLLKSFTNCGKPGRNPEWHVPHLNQNRAEQDHSPKYRRDEQEGLKEPSHNECDLLFVRHEVVRYEHVAINPSDLIQQTKEQGDITHCRPQTKG